jgi:hypothetical protein
MIVSFKTVVRIAVLNREMRNSASLLLPWVLAFGGIHHYGYHSSQCAFLDGLWEEVRKIT